MPYPEPSNNDHGAEWTRVTLTDIDGEEYDACGCNSCNKQRRDEAMEEYGCEDGDGYRRFSTR